MEHLTEKWCIKDGLSPEVTKYFNENGTSHYTGTTNQIFHYPPIDGACLHGEVQSGYTEITVEQFKKYILKQDTMKNITIKKSALKEIYDVACDAWQAKIENMTLRDAFSDSIQVTQDEIDEMFAAATPSQRPVLESIFGKPKPQIDFDQIRTGSRVMIKHTGRSCTGIEAIDLKQPVDVVFYKTPHLIDGSNRFKTSGHHDSYCTFHQNRRFVLFSADDDVDYITEVVEY